MGEIVGAKSDGTAQALAVPYTRRSDVEGEEEELSFRLNGGLWKGPRNEVEEKVSRGQYSVGKKRKASRTTRDGDGH